MQYYGFVSKEGIRAQIFQPGGIPGGEGLSVDVDDGLLPEVDPEDVLLVAVLLHDGLQATAEAVGRCLASSEHGETRELSGKLEQFTNFALFLEEEHF